MVVLKSIMLLLLSILMQCTTKKDIAANGRLANQLYSTVLTDFHEDKSRILYISKRTSMSNLREFRFQNPKSHSVDTVSRRGFETTEWRAFLSNIDLKEIQNTDLDKNMFDVRGKRIKIITSHEQKPGREGTKYTIILSPVIFSPDQQKAIVTLETYSGPEAAGADIIFLEKRTGKWVLVDNQMLWIS